MLAKIGNVQATLEATATGIVSQNMIFTKTLASVFCA